MSSYGKGRMPVYMEEARMPVYMEEARMAICYRE